jgi:amino acid permease
MSVHDLGFVISIVGSTGSIIVSLILPGLCYYKLVIGGHPMLRFIALMQCCIGIFLIPFCIFLLFLS